MSRYFLIIFLLCICSVSALLSACSETAGRHKITDYVSDEKDARAIAEDYFLEKTHRKIETYSITSGKQEIDYWAFFFEGTGEFERPGYHWIVKVNKQTGKPEIIWGE